MREKKHTHINRFQEAINEVMCGRFSAKSESPGCIKPSLLNRFANLEETFVPTSESRTSSDVHEV